MNDKFKILGRRVKFLRMNKNISQTHMAEMIGLSQTNLSNMGSGRTAITLQNIFKMREVLGCKIADFFVDFDGELIAEHSNADTNNSIELEDAVKILKLLKAVDVKGL